MRQRIAVVVAWLAALSAAASSQYLPNIQQRWDASDKVCTGLVKQPKRTGTTRRIENSDRDQLSAEVTIENCFKGQKPKAKNVRVLGYSFYALKDIQGKGIAYSGPPIGFVTGGRNLLFLRRTSKPFAFEMVVPIFESAIRLAESPPYYPNDDSSTGVRFALTQELEAAMLQFGSMDLVYIGHIFDSLGNQEAVLELRRFMLQAPTATQRDIAVALLEHGDMDCEPAVIALLQDRSAPAWRRQNAARALGDHGSERALPFLREVAAQRASTDDLKALRNWTLDSVHRLEGRLAQ